MRPAQAAVIVGLIALLAFYSRRSQGAVFVPGVNYDPIPNDEPAPGWIFDGWQWVPDFASAPYAQTDTAPDFIEYDPAVAFDDVDFMPGDFAQPVTGGFGMSQQEKNVAAMLAVIRDIESNGDYQIIAGGARFDDYREHPFILDPSRARPLGTTASGAYQMVVGTWKMARDALRLPDFSPASQDAAAVWILEKKRPRAWPYVLAGNFDQAARELVNEWEAFKKMLAGTYPITMSQARDYFTMNGGALA